MTKRGTEISVGEFIDMLKKENQDLPLYFGGLDFYRLKDRGAHVQVEFNQTVSESKEGIVKIENNILLDEDQ